MIEIILCSFLSTFFFAKFLFFSVILFYVLPVRKNCDLNFDSFYFIENFKSLIFLLICLSDQSLEEI